MTGVYAILAVLAIIYVVPLAVYAAANGIGWIAAPADSAPARFLLGILVTKLGTAVAFVLLFQLPDALWSNRWTLFAFIWFFMFATSEIGDAIAGRSTWREALLGIVSEAIYAPASAFVVFSIVTA